MDFVPLHSIIVPEKRIRRKFDAEAARLLEDSITRRGLFHPLLVRDDGCTLIAGERRLRCLDQLFSRRQIVYFDGKVLDGVVPVVRLHDADAEGTLDAELSENDARQQLTWQERAQAVEALHALRLAADPSHSRSATAEELGRVSKREVNDDIIVAGWLDDPDVANANSRAEAMKTIERKLVEKHREALNREFKHNPSGDLKCINLKMQDVYLPEAEPFDLIIADPPYGVGANTWDNQNAIEHQYEDTRETSNELYSFIARSIPVRDESHAYIFCDPRRFEAVRAMFHESGWRCWPWPLVWFRGSSIGLLPWPQHGPRRTWEAILFAIKGDKRTTGVFPDVISTPHDNATERGAHKPVALYADLIRRSCLPGDRVIDPCCGTGPIFPAALECKVRAVGFEPDVLAYNQALRRISDAQAGKEQNSEADLSLDQFGI